MNYYLRIRGKPFGPFDEQQLLGLKEKGKLNQTSELSPDKSQWSPAGDFSFLFPPSAVAPVAPEPAKATVSATPTAPITAPIAPPPLPSGGPAEWYYSTDGDSGYGPVEASEIVRQIQYEALHAESLIWRSGHSAQPIHTVPTFARYVAPQSAYAQPMRQQPIMQRSAMPQRNFAEQTASRSFFGWLFGWLLNFSFSNLELQTTNLLQFQVVQLWLCRIFYAIYFVLLILSCIGVTGFVLFGTAIAAANFKNTAIYLPFLLPFYYIWELWCLIVVRTMFEFGLLVVDWIVAARKAAKLYNAANE